MSDFEPSLFSLPKAMEGIHAGTVRLPSFQRPFKWQTPQQKALFDSVQKRHPAGTLLLLETSAAVGSPFGSEPFAHTPESARDGVGKFLVLDGQQRLTSCYLGIYNRGPRSFFLNLPELLKMSGGLPVADATIDLEALLIARPHVAMPDEFLFKSGWLPFSFLNSRETMRSKLSAYKDNLREKDPDDPLLRFLDSRFEGYVDPFFEYSFPAVILPATLDLDAVCKVFIVINTTGLKLSAFDLCVARFFPQGVDLKSKYKAALEAHLSISVLDPDGTNLLQTVALLSATADQKFPGQVVRVPTKKAGLPKHLQIDHLTEHWDEAVQGMMDAAQVISSASDSGGPFTQLVPYDAFVPSLAGVMAVVRRSAPGGIAPALIQAKLLRWFYTSALGQRYNEGTDQKQAEDFEQVTAWCLSAKAPQPDFISAATWNLTALRLSAKGSAIGRALLAALNRHHPVDPISGAILGFGRSGAFEIHHIFPRAYLAKRSVPNGQINSILNQTFLSPETNKWVSDDGPKAYLEDFAKEIAKRDELTLDVAEQRVKEHLRSHFISGATYEALKRNDFDAFIANRADELKRYIENEASVSLTVVAGADEQSIADLVAESEDDEAA